MALPLQEDPGTEVAVVKEAAKCASSVLSSRFAFTSPYLKGCRQQEGIKYFNLAVLHQKSVYFFLTFFFFFFNSYTYCVFLQSFGEKLLWPFNLFMEVAGNKCFPGLEIGCGHLLVSTLRTHDRLDNIICMQCPWAAVQEGVAEHREDAWAGTERTGPVTSMLEDQWAPKAEKRSSFPGNCLPTARNAWHLLEQNNVPLKLFVTQMGSWGCFNY